MKIVVLDGYTLNPGDLSWDEMALLGDLTVHDRLAHNEDEIINALYDADIALTNKTPLNDRVIRTCEKLKYIGVLATGFNVVDVKSAKQNGVLVSNIPSYATNATAQFTFALLLELCHRIGAHSEAVAQGEWVRSIDFSFSKYPLMELAEKNLGIIGFGRIGQQVARIAQAFGMNVHVYTRTPKPEMESDKLKMVGFEELISHSDVISLHCPLTPQTNGVINAECIAKMKNGVKLINTGRGDLIVEQDVYDALRTGKMSGFATDVVSVEPMKNDNPLLNAQNAIVTPHIAWAPTETRQRLMNIAIDNVKHFIENNPKNIVND